MEVHGEALCDSVSDNPPSHWVFAVYSSGHRLLNPYKVKKTIAATTCSRFASLLALPVGGRFLTSCHSVQFLFGNIDTDKNRFVFSD